ncbi:hypothetical protein NPIL_133281 [Nephila pilipes]|uniref:C2H2-type domain-containing protein n=1 Tax=Nephila pilipes TaxID=299642 RepID=A0A8X6QCK3_NEPPI|nr:hypothetical protein NPIL_133281 [Nephila pilipes]
MKQDESTESVGTTQLSRDYGRNRGKLSPCRIRLDWERNAPFGTGTLVVETRIDFFVLFRLNLFRKKMEVLSEEQQPFSRLSADVYTGNRTCAICDKKFRPMKQLTKHYKDCHEDFQLLQISLGGKNGNFI